MFLAISSIVSSIQRGMSESDKIKAQKEIADLTAKATKEQHQLILKSEKKKQTRSARSLKLDEDKIASMRASATDKMDQKEDMQIMMALAPHLFQSGGGVDGEAPVASQALAMGDDVGGGTEALESMLAGVSPEYAQRVLADAGGRAPSFGAAVRRDGRDLEMFRTGDTPNEDVA